MVLSSAGQSNHPLPPVPEPSIETHPTHDPPRTRPVSPEPTQATRAQTGISGLGVGVALPSSLFAHEQQPKERRKVTVRPETAARRHRYIRVRVRCPATLVLTAFNDSFGDDDGPERSLITVN